MKTLITTLLTLLAAPLAAQAPEYALEFQKGTTLTFPHDKIMLTGKTFTCEAWVAGTRLTGSSAGLFGRYSGSREHKDLVILSDGSIAFEYAGSPWKHGQKTAAKVFPFDGAWHHVAFVRHSSGAHEVYVDGKAVYAKTKAPCWLTCDIIGTSTTTTIAAGGLRMAALRVSKIDRYSKAFVPSWNLASDKDVVMLVPFAEGKGATVIGTGPAKQKGKLSGSYRWVRLQKASFQTFGKGCGSSQVVPALGSMDNPVLGKKFSLYVLNLRPNTFGVLFFGNSNTAWQGMRLPLSLSNIGMPNCKMLVSYDILVPFLTGNGSYKWTATVPASAGLLGDKLHAQAWSPDRNANATGVGMTNGVSGVIGSR